jgi:hypothetical protein
MNINTKAYIESFIKIRNKEGKIVDFRLNNPQQKLYDIIKEQKKAKKPVRIIILKARQMGFSTLTESILFKETVTKFNRRTGIITHLASATTNLFNMSKLMLDCLPDEIKPSVKRSNAQELIFDNDNGTGLKSKIKCMTAGTSGVGRSDTFDNLHLSELAFWEGDVTATLTGLFQAVPNLPDTMIIIESTANGFEKFKELWDQAVNGESDFIPLFVAWHEMPEYAMPYSGFKLTEEEEKLKELYNLTNDQLEWRRWCIRNNCQNDIDQFKQEYPSNPEEAFLSTGSCIFDKDAVINRLRYVPKPIKQGYFVYNEEDARHNIMSDIKWVSDKKGCIKIFKLPNTPAISKNALDIGSISPFRQSIVIEPTMINRSFFSLTVSMISHSCRVLRLRRLTSSVMIVSPAFAPSSSSCRFFFTLASPCSYSKMTSSAPAAFNSLICRVMSCLSSLVLHLA